MAANPPYEGAEFVPGTSDSVGVELLKHVEDPKLVIAYAGYGFWAPADAVAAVKGTEKQDLTNAPIAPVAPGVDASEYVSREVDQYGQPVEADPRHEETRVVEEVDLQANKGPADFAAEEAAGVDGKTDLATPEAANVPEADGEPAKKPGDAEADPVHEDEAPADEDDKPAPKRASKKS